MNGFNKLALMKKTVFLFSLICFSAIVSAQSTFSGWTALFNSIKLGNKTSLLSDLQLRSTDELQQVQTILLRSGLNYSLSKKTAVTAGYAYVDNRRSVNGISGLLPEHRIWEQFLINHKLSRIAITHRFRLEQRFISKGVVEGQDLKTDGFSNANRFRYFIRNMIPVGNAKAFNQGFFGAVQNEVFLNFGNKSAVNGKTFDQNRLYLAAGYRFGKTFDLEAGYMYQFVEGRGNQSVNNNIIQLAGYLRI